MIITDPQDVLYHDTKVVRSTYAGLEQGIPLIIQQGGTSSGKTFGTLDGMCLFLQDYPHRYTASVFGQTSNHLRTGALKDFKDITSKMGNLRGGNDTNKTYQIGRGVIEFLSVDKIGKAKGPRRDFMFVNEGNYMPYDIFTQLDLRTAKTVIIDYNPSSRFWLHDEHLPSLTASEYLFKRTTYLDNPNLTEKQIRKIERLKEIDEQLWRVYGLGLTGQITGLVFPNHQTVHEFPEDLKHHGYGLDFGYSNHPAVLGEFGINQGKLYGRQLVYETGLLNKDLSDKMEQLGVNRNLIIAADSAEPKSIAELRSYGWNVHPAKKGKDSVKFGINQIKSFGTSHVHVSSLDAIKEYGRYKWKISKDGKKTNEPVKVFDHYMDAKRYWGSLHVFQYDDLNDMVALDAFGNLVN